jgi:hypothetical protein
LFATLATCAALWCALAFWLARHSPLAGVLQRALRFALPFVLIAVGTYILGHTVTDVLARRGIRAHQDRSEPSRFVTTKVPDDWALLGTMGAVMMPGQHADEFALAAVEGSGHHRPRAGSKE